MPRNPVAALLFIAGSILRPPPPPPSLLLLKVAAKIKDQRAAWQASHYSQIQEAKPTYTWLPIY